MQRAMTRPIAADAVAERQKRAKIITAQGEALAAGEPARASDAIMADPLALRLRNLQALVEVGAVRAGGLGADGSVEMSRFFPQHQSSRADTGAGQEA
jgi:hypothetical protein